MAYVWSKDLETGNAMIDSQHKELIEAINALARAVRRSQKQQNSYMITPPSILVTRRRSSFVTNILITPTTNSTMRVSSALYGSLPNS